MRAPLMTLTASVLTIMMALAYMGAKDWPLAQRLEGQLLDLRFRLRGPEKPSGDIALIVVDERSLLRYGRWPVSRSLYATLVDTLSAAKAKTIVFDLFFSEPETTLPPELRESLTTLARDADPRTAPIRDLLSKVGPDDQLAQAFARAGNVIIPFSFRLGDDGGAESILIQSKSNALADPQYKNWAYNIYQGEPELSTLDRLSAGVLTPLHQLNVNALGAGHDDNIFESDGALRFDYAAGGWEGKSYPSLSVRAAAAFAGAAWNNVALYYGQGIRAGALRIPIDRLNRVIVNYNGPTGTFPTYSLVDVLDGKINRSVFTDKLVLIGPAAIGVTDYVRTPFEDQMPGVERYASILDHMLHGGALQQPDWVRPANCVAIILLGLLIAITAPRSNLGLAFVFAAASLLTWFYVCRWAFEKHYLWLNMLFPSATVIITFASVVLMRGIAEERRRRKAEISLRSSEERYALSARGANDGLFDWDLVTEHFYTSPRWHEIVGVGAAELNSSTADWYGRVLSADLSALQGAVQAHLAGGTAHLEHEFRLRHADGSERWMLVRGLKVVDAGKKPVRMAGSMTDITVRKQSQEQLLFDALFDRLTGLANRASLRERTDFALQMMARDSGRDALVAILDLDRFKDINDSLGIGTGDKLLISVARALQEAVGPQDTLARLGEDEYGILRLFDGDPAVAIDALVPALQQAIARPFNIDERVIEITASIGIAVASEAQAGTAETLLSDANLAVYRAKTLGRERAIKFDPSMQQSALKRLDLVSDLRQAVARGNELELFYQPIIKLQGEGGIHGFEALIRWRHPERGLVSPGDFIPIAEETGLIVEIGRRSIWQTCRQIAAWIAQTGFAPQVAVNVSGRQLESEQIVEDIRQALAETAIPTEKLKIEVTESMVMDNPERAQALLVRIMGLGVKISIDDFGTGYSSLSHLHRFPFNTLKIDRSFVIRLTENREGFEICKAIAKLAHILHRDVVAEGIETPEQAGHLRDLDVEYGQGYLFSKPLPVAEATAFMLQQLAAKQPKQVVPAQ